MLSPFSSPRLCSSGLVAAGWLLSLGSARCATVYAIDIDSTRLTGATTTGGPVMTEPGFTSLDATNPANSNGASVTIDTINFAIFSADGSRVRVDGGGSAVPNAFTGDFVFDDGAGQAVGVTFGGAGSLLAGDWQVEVWIWDQGFVDANSPMIVGYRTNGAETLVSTNAIPDPVVPSVTFQFTSDGAAAYDVFVRENNAGDRSRLNAVRLTLIPEPSALWLAVASMTSALVRRRRAA